MAAYSLFLRTCDTNCMQSKAYTKLHLKCRKRLEAVRKQNITMKYLKFLCQTSTNGRSQAPLMIGINVSIRRPPM